MNSLIQALGIDWRILLAQLFNFSILVFILWRFAYRPIFNLLEERRKKIEQGMKDSEAATVKLEASLQEGKEIVVKARQEANAIVEEAQARAEARYQEVVGKAKEDLRVIMEKEKEKIVQEKEAITGQVKKEVIDLLVLSLNKILGENMDSEKDKQVISKIVKGLS